MRDLKILKLIRRAILFSDLMGRGKSRHPLEAFFDLIFIDLDDDRPAVGAKRWV